MDKKNEEAKEKGMKNGPPAVVVAEADPASDTANDDEDDHDTPRLAAEKAEQERLEATAGAAVAGAPVASLLDRFANEMRVVWEIEVLTKRLNSEDRAMLARQGKGWVRWWRRSSVPVPPPPSPPPRPPPPQETRTRGVFLLASVYTTTYLSP